jgi:branched-chain amino acid transport system permease protein
MDQFLQFTVSALTLACTVSLIATGWVLIYQVSEVLNLAQGSFVVIGGLLFASLTGDYGVPLVLAVVITILVGAGLGVASDFVVLKPARQVTGLAPIFITLGLAYVLGDLTRTIWGADPMTTGHFLTDRPFQVGGVSIQAQAVVLWAATVFTLLALWIVFDRTLIGKSMRACAQSPQGATLVGINPARVRSIAFGVAAGLGALSGALLIPLSPMSWSDGLHIGLQGLVAAILGRWSYAGAVAGAVLLAAAETYTAGYVSSAWKDAVWLLLLILVLLAAATRPRVRLRRPASDRRATAGAAA